MSHQKTRIDKRQSYPWQPKLQIRLLLLLLLSVLLATDGGGKGPREEARAQPRHPSNFIWDSIGIILLFLFMQIPWKCIEEEHIREDSRANAATTAGWDDNHTTSDDGERQHEAVTVTRRSGTTMDQNSGSEDWIKRRLRDMLLGHCRGSWEKCPRRLQWKRQTDKNLLDVLRGFNSGRPGRRVRKSRRGRERAAAGRTRKTNPLVDRELFARRVAESTEQHRLAIRIRWQTAAKRQCHRRANGREAQSELKQISTAHLAHRGRPPDRQRNDSA